MSNTVIKIRRSTSSNTPGALQSGELAFTSNGDTLWVGSPSGANTANVIHIASKVSYIGNSTQIGASAGGSNAELASTYAIKEFVDGKLGAFSTSFEGLTDVDVATKANNDLIVYDAATGNFENHTISGTSNQVNVSFSDQNITVGLTNNVTIAANLSVTNQLSVNGESNFGNVIHVEIGGVWAQHTVNNPILQAEANTNDYVQISLHNRHPGANASGDFIAYPNNTQVDDNTGFVDMGITSNGFNQAAFAVTTTNDGYIFASARSGDGLGGSLVLATDSTGVNNDIKMFVGGFTYNHYEPHAVLAGNTRAFGINNTAPVSRLSVGGDAWINGKIQAHTLTPLANVTYSLGNTTSWYLSLYANTVTGTNANFTSIGGTLTTGNQPNITNTGTLDTLTVTGITTLNGNVLLGSDSSDIVSIKGVVNTNIIPSANVTYNIGNANYQYDKIYAANAYFTNALIGGDLTVQGTLTTIDTVNLTIKDSLMSLADQQANSSLFTDAVDIGFFGQYGNTGTTIYTGLTRHALSNTYVLFDGLANQMPNNVVNTAAITLTTLNSYLLSGGFVSNSSTISIAANSTINVAIVANTLTLSTALGVGSGGLGLSTLSNNYVMVGNSGGPVTMVGSSTEGHVLQINASGSPTFSGLDGGTF